MSNHLAPAQNILEGATTWPALVTLSRELVNQFPETEAKEGLLYISQGWGGGAHREVDTVPGAAEPHWVSGGSGGWDGWLETQIRRILWVSSTSGAELEATSAAEGGWRLRYTGATEAGTDGRYHEQESHYATLFAEAAAHGTVRAIVLPAPARLAGIMRSLAAATTPNIICRDPGCSWCRQFE